MSDDPATSDAIARCEKYLKFDPTNTVLLKNLGDLYHQAGRFDDAIACYEKSLSYDPEDLVARSRHAGVLISQHRFREAEKILRDVLSRGEQDSTLLHNLGLTLYYQHRWEEAQQAFEGAIGGGLHDAPKTLSYLTYALHHQGDTERALEHCQKWLQQEPTDEVQAYLALLELDHGDVANAYRRAAEVLERQPENCDAAVVSGNWSIEQQDGERALTLFNRVAQAEPDNPRGWLGLGLVYMYQQKPPEAIQALEKALKFMPDNTGTLVALGWAKLVNKDAVAAERTFRDALATDRNFAESHGGLATALAFQNRQDEAREAIKRAQRIDPKGFGAVFAHSILLQLQGKKESATKLLSRLLEQAPRPDGPTLIESIQQFVRQQTVHGPAPERKPTLRHN